MNKTTIRMLCMVLVALLLCGCAAKPDETDDMGAGKTPGQEAPTDEGAKETDPPKKGKPSDNYFKVGDEADDFSVVLLSGDTVHLSDFRGQVVLLNFFASWCNPCQIEMPAFERLQEEYPEDLVVFAVNCAERKETVAEFIEENGYTFMVGLDEENVIYYPTNAIPYTLVLDREGKITHIQVGAGDAEWMYSEIYKPAIEAVLNAE
ncbi:TlpA family protein disulfide reductase [Christensenellaceae bacterium OttesenSCG-928-L17]|nr:TlpA family protein disulfide reductase [Christensenellaceae bacterium OttesenSCG-928-L17]